ncbi:polymorphic toxin-type HINT domain-containing protein [Streptacidiphilus carbonis]|uniref:polymorphic toxin-type HINT domain-containing protein n=1 Tax=Streptacidiphilus carbonis TaxID=105422 RepID=UPI0006936E0F|nr:polymorphic toxin-type HINT domain-containing protein [Streptacidiphilus carbonis]
MSAVSVDVEATGSSAGGYLALWADGTAKPSTSTVNLTTGVTADNAAILAVGSDGKVDVYNAAGTVDVRVVVNGYYTTTAGTVAPGGYVPIAPTRLVDTRVGTGAVMAQVPAGGSIDVQVDGVAGITGESAVFANLTVPLPAAGGSLYAYPSGAASGGQPIIDFSSTTRSSGAIVAVGSNGKITLRNGSTTAAIDVMMDISGFFAAAASTGGGFTPVAARLLDTRTTAAIPANSAVNLQVGGTNGIPAHFGAAALNLVAISGNSPGHLVAWPTGQSMPTLSLDQFQASAVTAAMSVVAANSTGSVSVYNSSAAPIQVVVDLQGWFAYIPPPSNGAAFDPAAAAQVREDQCLMSTMVRLGGPVTRQVATAGLDGTDAQLHTAADRNYANETATPLHAGYTQDAAAYKAQGAALFNEDGVWEKPLQGLPVPLDYPSDAAFLQAPGQLGGDSYFDTVGLGPWLEDRMGSSEDKLYTDPTPLAGADSVTAATALGNALYSQPTDGNDPNFAREYNEYNAWQDMTFMHGLFADDTRMLLENGGFARTASAPGTAEFRVAVEDLKTRFASCEWRNPEDPNNVLGAEVQAASTEWQAEIAGQVEQRDAVFADSTKATAALAAGSKALGEALGQSWSADHLSHWQAYWGPGGAGFAGTGPITFQLKSATTQCLDDKGGSTANSAVVESYTCNGGRAQQWTPTSNGVLDGPLVNTAGNTCLDVDGTHGPQVPGTVVQLYKCNGTASQHWQYTTTAGVTRLYNVGSKLCLNFASTAQGAGATVGTCNGSAPEQFTAQQNNTGTSTGIYSPSYPTAAQFTSVKNALPVAQAAAKAQLVVAQQQAAIAQQAADDTTTVEQQAYAIADSAGEPRGRGLLAAQQEAQVTMASSAALQAIVKATETAYQATTASAADAATLQALAETQTHASTAAFRLAAANEADAQAKAAAAGAAQQAKNAAAANTTAQGALATAQQAEQTAKTAADTAHAKRQAAEAQQATAAAKKNEAAADEATAASDQVTADQDAATAATALAAAQTAGATAAQKRTAATQADQAATTARQNAWDAAQTKNALQAKADAADAYADAEDGNADAQDAQSAATAADTDAANASTAADGASTAADAATTAAQAADAAATQAEAAASRAQSDADAAQAAKATADAAVRTGEAAVATAVAASQQASSDATAAQADAATAEAQAKQAQTDAIAAGTAAQAAQTSAATAAGYAYTTAQAAGAAASAAAQVIAPANDAIQLGAPYVNTDASAGLAVLSAQASKTVADQQQAVAQAKSAQAAQAAQTAQAIADAATGDAKAAQVPVADAAAQAAQAQASAQQALASAAQAQKAMADAQAAQAQTVAYDTAATADAAAAQAAAQAAAGDATDARASANAAESDATAAQQAATTAQTAAATAREVAQQADQDATAAEAAAKDADAQAASAQQAATAAEQAQDAATVTSGGATGTPQMFTTEKVTPIGDPVPDNDCVLGLGSTGCDVTFTLNFTLTIDFYLCDADVAPTDLTAAGCPADNTTFLDSQSQPASQKVTHHFSTWDITKAIDEGVLKGLWDSVTADFVNCAHGNITSCAWAATWFVPQSKILDAIKLVGKLNDAIRTGLGIDDALKAVEAIGLDAKAMAELKAEVQATDDALTGCVINSFPSSAQVLLADGNHKAISSVRIGDRLLAIDPATGRSQAEPVTATFAHDTDTLLDIKLSGGSTLSTTTGHRVYAVNRGWILAADLRPGDLLQAANGSSSAVTALSTRTGLAPQQVYDLTVDGLHTFYIRSTGAQSQDLLVHNCNNLVDDAVKYPDLAHTLSDHVTDAATAIAKAKAELAAGGKGITSVFVDAQTAQQVVDYAIASDAEKNPKRLANWLSRSKNNPTELYPITGTFGAKNSIGTIYKADESFRAAGNGYTVLLKRMPGHPRGYIVYTAYPTA